MVQRLKTRTRNQFSLVSVAEVGSLDIHQRIELGLSVVAGDFGQAESVLDAASRFIGSLGLAQVVDDDREVFQFGDELGTEGDWVSAKYEADYSARGPDSRGSDDDEGGA